MNALFKEPICARVVWAYRVGQDPSDSKSNRYMLTSSGFHLFIGGIFYKFFLNYL